VAVTALEIKGWAAFPNDESVYRLIYLGLEQVSRKWTMPVRNWKAALQQLAILYQDRLPLEALALSATSPCEYRFHKISDNPQTIQDERPQAAPAARSRSTPLLNQTK
jgi:hypothetical protein